MPWPDTSRTTLPEISGPALEREMIESLEARGYLVMKPGPAQHESFELEAPKGDRIKIAVHGDTHLGSYFQQPTYLAMFLNYAREQKVNLILHLGDLVDGNSIYRGQQHEVFLSSMNAQIDYAIETQPKAKVPAYMIGGNHDWNASAGDCAAKAFCTSRTD